MPKHHAKFFIEISQAVEEEIGNIHYTRLQILYIGFYRIYIYLEMTNIWLNSNFGQICVLYSRNLPKNWAFDQKMSSAQSILPS